MACIRMSVPMERITPTSRPASKAPMLRGNPRAGLAGCRLNVVIGPTVGPRITILTPSDALDSGVGANGAQRFPSEP